jgi:hypothetical protein
VVHGLVEGPDLFAHGRVGVDEGAQGRGDLRGDVGEQRVGEVQALEVHPLRAVERGAEARGALGEHPRDGLERQQPRALVEHALALPAVVGEGAHLGVGGDRGDEGHRAVVEQPGHHARALEVRRQHLAEGGAGAHGALAVPPHAHLDAPRQGALAEQRAEVVGDGRELGAEGVDHAAQERDGEGGVFAHEGLEALGAEPPEGERGGRDDARRAGRAGDQRDLAEVRAGPERAHVEPLARHPRLAAHDEVEVAAGVALADHDRAGRVGLFVEVREQSREAVVAEAGDERRGRGGEVVHGRVQTGRSGRGSAADGRGFELAHGVDLVEDELKHREAARGGAGGGVAQGRPHELGEDPVRLGVEREPGDHVSVGVSHREELQKAPDARVAEEAAGEGPARGGVPGRVLVEGRQRPIAVALLEAREEPLDHLKVVLRALHRGPPCVGSCGETPTQGPGRAWRTDNAAPPAVGGARGAVAARTARAAGSPHPARAPRVTPRRGSAR